MSTRDRIPLKIKYGGPREAIEEGPHGEFLIRTEKIIRGGRYYYYRHGYLELYFFIEFDRINEIEYNLVVTHVWENKNFQVPSSHQAVSNIDEFKENVTIFFKKRRLYNINDFFSPGDGPRSILFGWESL